MRTYFLLLCCVFALPIHAETTKYNSYFGMNLGVMSEASIKKSNLLFGNLTQKTSTPCLFDGRKYVIFRFSPYPQSNGPESKTNSRSRSIIFKGVSISTKKPNRSCQQRRVKLPGFDGLDAGMFSFEIINALNKHKFKKSKAEKGRAIYTRQFVSKPQCIFSEGGDYSADMYYYGSNVDSIHITLADVSRSVVGSISKTLTSGFVEERNFLCDSKNTATKF